jgi:hypothetical protein
LISPQLFLALVLAVTAGAWLVERTLSSRRRRALRKFAADHKLQYARQDLFNLARRVESQWPIPECSEWRVGDLIYGTVGTVHRYIFTVQFTLGPLDRYRRDVRVATCCEPCEGCGCVNLAPRLAERSGDLVQQYQALIEVG